MDTHRRTLLLGGLGLAAAGLIATPALPQARTPVVRTTFGPVRGSVENGVNVFKGMRYAAPPVGPLRFKPPEPPKPWTEPVDAIAFGAPAVQMYSGPDLTQSAMGKALSGVFPIAQEVAAGSEDCLFLNVWTPGLGDNKRRPVMVWFHGGGHAYGSGAWPMYDGRNLAKRGDVVVVTVNHRLNAFGYAYLAEAMGEAYAKSGNAGILDLVAVLEWVRDNAEAFGGDPKNVTIFGESGGGAKVSTLMATPAAKGLFHKAIVQSGPGLQGAPKEAAAKMGQMLLDELKIAKGDVAALQAVPAAEIVKAAVAAQAKAAAANPQARFGMGPVVDGVVLPRDPFTPDAPPQSADIPLLIGTNKDEMTLFMASAPWFGRLTDAQLVEQARQQAGPKADAVLAALRKTHPGYSPSHLATALATSMFMLAGSITQAERKAAQNAAPVWMYRVDWETPVGFGVLKSPHAIDIPLVFDTVETNRPLLGPGPGPQAVAERMSAAWIAFARTGKPGAADLPNWPPYEPERRATMIFDTTSRLENDPWPELRRAIMS